MEMIVITISKKHKIGIKHNMYKNKMIKDMEIKDLIESKDINEILVLGRIKV